MWWCCVVGSVVHLVSYDPFTLRVCLGGSSSFNHGDGT